MSEGRWSAWTEKLTAQPWPPSPEMVRRAAIFLAACLVALVLGLWPVPEGAPPKALLALGLATFTVILWGTQAIPQPLAATIFMALLLVTGAGTWRTISVSFVSNAAWLVLGGLLIATAAERSGFGGWVARRFLSGFQDSYPRLILGILLGTTMLSFLVPSNMGRVAITVPVVIALAREAGYAQGSNGYNGLVIAAVLGNFNTALAVLPANLLNIMIVATGEAMYGQGVSYLRWLILCGPVLGVAKGALMWWLIQWLFPAPQPNLQPGTATASGPLSAEGLRVAGVLAIAILLWASDVVHGIRPGWVAIGAAIVLYLPRIGVLAPIELLDTKRLVIVVWIAGVQALAASFAETGASDLLSKWLGRLIAIEGKSALYGHFAIAFLTSALTLVATMGATVPTMMAAVGGVSKATGLPIETGMVSLTVGATALWLPYVAAPMVVGLTIGKVALDVAAKFTLWSAALSWLIIIPLNALWWWLIGALP